MCQFSPLNSLTFLPFYARISCYSNCGISGENKSRFGSLTNQYNFISALKAEKGRQKMALSSSGEKVQWIMTIVNTIHSVFDTIGDAANKMPEAWKQKLPGFLGLSLTDERLFWGVVGRLAAKKQVLITHFLRKKCKDYERNRFINIVAGMEVSQEKLPESEKKFDKDGNLTYEKTKGGSPGIDCRFTFLDSFAGIIETEFGNDLDKAYEYCIGGRMIIANPIHQQVLKFFSEDTSWFKKTILNPIKATSLTDIPNCLARQVASVNDFLAQPRSNTRPRRSFLKDHPFKASFWKGERS